MFFSSFLFLLSILCILCVCIVLCVVSPFTYRYSFPIFVEIYRPLPPGGNPIAVNKCHINTHTHTQTNTQTHEHTHANTNTRERTHAHTHAHTNTHKHTHTHTYIDIYTHRIIHKSLRDFRPLQYSSRDGNAEGEHVNRGRHTPSFCPTLQVLDMSTLGVCLGR